MAAVLLGSQTTLCEDALPHSCHGQVTDEVGTLSLSPFNAKGMAATHYVNAEMEL